MAKQIKLTLTAYKDLNSILHYYNRKFSNRSALKVSNAIYKTINRLREQPNLGFIEANLTHKIYHYRGIIEGRFKIIYRVENNYILIVHIFDCQQSPKRISEDLE